MTVIEEAQERLKDATLAETIESLLERVEYKDHLVDGSEEGNDRWQNVQELVTKLRDYDNMDGEAALRAFLEEAALVQAADSLESAEAGAVTLITLHAAKGLEFPIVFIIGLEDGISPHSRAIGPEGSIDQLEEERRLLYVGVTRAEQRLFLVYAAERTLYGERREQMRSLLPGRRPAPSADDCRSARRRAAPGSGDRLLSQSRGGWGRGSSSGYGSRGEAAARYRQPPAAVPAVADARAEAAAPGPRCRPRAGPAGPGHGHRERHGRHGGQSSFDDLGVDAGRQPGRRGRGASAGRRRATSAPAAATRRHERPAPPGRRGRRLASRGSGGASG